MTLQLVEPCLPKLPPWSHAFLSTADNCPHQALHKFVLRDVERRESQQQKDGIALHEALARRISRKTPLAEPFALLEPVVSVMERPSVDLQAELKLGVRLDGSSCGFFDEDCFGRGAIDVCGRSGTRALIIDWKNGKIRENPFELQIQSVLLKAKYPDLTQIFGHYFWVKELQLGPCYDLSDTSSAWRMIMDRVTDIVRCAKMNSWPKVQSPLCGWCEVKSCEHCK
jgi:hypothetical protein